MVQVEALPVALLRVFANEGNQKIAGIPVRHPGFLEFPADFGSDAEPDAGSEHNTPGNGQLTGVP